MKNMSMLAVTLRRMTRVKMFAFLVLALDIGIGERLNKLCQKMLKGVARRDMTIERKKKSMKKKS